MSTQLPVQGGSYFKVAGPNPAPSSTPGSGAGTPGGGAGKLESSLSKHRTLWLAGAGVGVVGLALFMSRGETAAEPNTNDDFELDTRDTDVYNELQPELEQVADRLDELETGPYVGPRPPHTIPPKPGHHDGPRHNGGKPHHGPKAGKPKKRPKPGSPADRREDRRDKREDKRDRRHRGGIRDLREDIRDRREDIAERRENRQLRRDRLQDQGPRKGSVPRRPGRPGRDDDNGGDRRRGADKPESPAKKLVAAAARNAKPKARRG